MSGDQEVQELGETPVGVSDGEEIQTRGPSCSGVLEPPAVKDE